MIKNSNNSAILKEIEVTANRILQTNADASVRVRLLRDVLHRSDDDPVLLKASDELSNHKWIQLLKDKQDQNGNFPRLHKDLRHVGMIEAVDKSLNLGLTPDHPILFKTKQFAEKALTIGVSNVRPLLEKDNCPFSQMMADSLWELILANILTKLQPTSKLIDPVFHKWYDIVKHAFRSGQYNQIDEKEKFEDIFNIEFPIDKCQRHKPVGGIDAHLTLELLGARAELLDTELEKLYFEWFFDCNNLLENNKISFALQYKDYSYTVARLLINLNIMSVMPSWRKYTSDIINNLWHLREENGYWDFGNKRDSSGYIIRIMLSNSWRKAKNRQYDWTTWVLLLLKKYYDK